MKIEIKILDKEFYKKTKLGGEYYDLPDYQTFGSAAMDLYCTENVVLYPGETKLINTGLEIWVGSANGYCRMCKNSGEYLDNFGTKWSCPCLAKYKQDIAGLILPRSGLGTKGLVLANTVGLIDSDYQGELRISAWNRNDATGWEDLYLHDVDKKRWFSTRPFRVSDSPNSAIELKAGDRFAQLMFIPVIKAELEIVDEFSSTTQRGTLGFGSSGK